MSFKIGIMADWLGLPFPEAMAKASELGAQGVQIYTTSGDMSPENMGAARRREVLDIIKSNGLVVSALCGDLGMGFTNREKNIALIEKSKRIMELALDLETSAVTTHIGVIPADKNSDVYKIMSEACNDLAGYGDSVGAAFAVETGPEPAARLFEFLEGLSSKGVRVNFDPANLRMCMDEDPAESVAILGKYIVHTHAKDGIYLGQGSYKELPLGEGGVNFDTYLPALAGTGFSGFLTIERECRENPIKDIAMAVNFLKEKIKTLGLS